MQYAGQIHKDMVKVLLGTRDRQEGFRGCPFAEPCAEARDAHVLTKIIFSHAHWHSQRSGKVGYPNRSTQFSMERCKSQQETSSVGMATEENEATKIGGDKMQSAGDSAVSKTNIVGTFSAKLNTSRAVMNVRKILHRVLV